MPDPLQGEVFHVLTRDNLKEKRALVDRLIATAPYNRGYVADIRRGLIVGFIIEADRRIVHYGYLFLRNRMACILGMRGATAVIGNAFTVPDYRGKSAQSRSVMARSCLAGQAGFETIAAETSPDNHASQRGMSKAGMQRIGRMDVVVVLSILVLRWRRPAGFPMVGFCLGLRPIAGRLWPG